MFKDYKYSVISKTYIASFFRFLLLSTSNVRMSEGTFCRVEVCSIYKAYSVYARMHPKLCIRPTLILDLSSLDVMLFGLYEEDKGVLEW